MINRKNFFHRYIIFLLLVYIAPAKAVERHEIHGRLTDAETGKPIVYANVFLANTTLGTTSDSQGRFVIERVPPGQFTLVIGMMGYAMEQVPVQVTDAGPTHLPLIRLKPQAIQGETIEISAERPVQWEKQLKKFLPLFLGTSARAEQCRILNPEFLDFETKPDGALSATARAPLIIENPVLGYHITLYLTRFLALPGKFLSFDIDAHFTPMTPQDNKQQSQWDKARNNAFLGSMNHFLRMAGQKKLKEADYEVYALTGLPTARTTVQRTPLLLDSLVSNAPNAHDFMLRAPEYMMIIYKGQPMPDDYAKVLSQKKGVSGVRFIKGPQESEDYPISYLKTIGSPVTVHRDGYLYIPQLTTSYGFWETYRVADMLPLDYKSDFIDTEP